METEIQKYIEPKLKVIKVEATNTILQGSDGELTPGGSLDD